MTFKSMKFVCKDVEHNLEIQRVLYKLGYKWNSFVNGSFSDAPHLFTYSSGKIQYGDVVWFDMCTSKQHWCEAGGILEYNPDDAAFKVKSPLGLRPKYVCDSLRSQEILEAMHRYTQAGKEVPYEWYEELGNTLKIEGE